MLNKIITSIKIFISIYLLFLVISINNVYAENIEQTFAEKYNCINYQQIDEDEYEKNSLGGEYNIFKDSIYNSYCLVKDADINSFQVINIQGRNYGKDKNYIYFGLKTLIGIDPDNFESKKIELFETLNDDRAYYVAIYDDDTIWLDGIDFSLADINSLEYLYGYLSDDNMYFRDNKNLFLIKEKNGELRSEEQYYAETINKANPDYFTHSYNIADNAVYWHGVKIEDADADSFEIYNWAQWSKDSQFAHDKNNVFLKDQILYDADVESFIQQKIYDKSGKIIDSVVLDKNNVFYRDEYLTTKELMNKYQHEAKKIESSIQSAIEEYETKYPGYTPQPAKPPIATKDVWPYGVGFLFLSVIGGVLIIKRKKK